MEHSYTYICTNPQSTLILFPGLLWVQYAHCALTSVFVSWPEYRLLWHALNRGRPVIHTYKGRRPGQIIVFDIIITFAVKRLCTLSQLIPDRKQPNCGSPLADCLQAEPLSDLQGSAFPYSDRELAIAVILLRKSCHHIAGLG